MPPSRLSRSIARGSKHVGPLRALPMVRLLAAAEVLMLARQHVVRLEPAERRRFIELIREAHGRRRNLSPQQRDELADLVAKTAPRQFALEAASKFSPVRIPNRFVQGKGRRDPSR